MQNEKDKETSNSENLVERSVRLFSPSKDMSLRLTVLDIIPKFHPKHQTVIMLLLNNYLEVFQHGESVSEKWLAAEIDRATLQDELRLLKIEHQKLIGQIKLLEE